MSEFQTLHGTTRNPIGPATVLGVLSTIVAAVGTVIAAAKTNDVATATGGVAAILTAVATLGGRYAQAVAQIRQAASVAADVFDGLGDPADLSDEVGGIEDRETHSHLDDGDEHEGGVA